MKALKTVPVGNSSLQVQVGTRGAIFLPLEVRKQLDLGAGDRLVLSVEEDGSMRLRSLREQVKKALGLFQHLAPDVDLAEELIQVRRAGRPEPQGCCKPLGSWTPPRSLSFLHGETGAEVVKIHTIR
jgi:AbrB family looped-hinge helix DNA binding protein